MTINVESIKGKAICKSRKLHVQLSHPCSVQSSIQLQPKANYNPILKNVNTVNHQSTLI